MSMLYIFYIAAALIVLGVFLKKRGRDQGRYIENATEAGTNLSKLDDVYYVYSVNMSLMGNLAIWLGIGLLIASVFL